MGGAALGLETWSSGSLPAQSSLGPLGWVLQMRTGRHNSRTLSDLWPQSDVYPYGTEAHCPQERPEVKHGR